MCNTNAQPEPRGNVKILTTEGYPNGIDLPPPLKEARINGQNQIHNAVFQMMIIPLGYMCKKDISIPKKILKSFAHMVQTQIKN